jgi:hypothetical protein
MATDLEEGHPQIAVYLLVLAVQIIAAVVFV